MATCSAMKLQCLVSCATLLTVIIILHVAMTALMEGVHADAEIENATGDHHTAAEARDGTLKAALESSQTGELQLPDSRWPSAKP